MSERPPLQKHHSSSSVAHAARSPAHRAQNGPIAGPRARLGARVPSHARNINRMPAQRIVLPRNKSKTSLRKNQSETALHRRNRSSADILALSRRRVVDEDEDEEEEQKKEKERIEGEGEGQWGGAREEEDDDVGGAAGVAGNTTTTTTTFAPATTQSTNKTSNTQQQTSKEASNNQKSIRFILRDAASDSSKSTQASDDTQATIRPHHPKPSTASSSTIHDTSDFNDFYSKPYGTAFAIVPGLTTAVSAMNLQASLDRDRAFTMQVQYAYPPSMWKDHKMREVIPHLTNPDPEEDPYYAKYCARLDRNMDKKLENIIPVNNALYRSLQRIGADPVAAELAEHKVKEVVPKPVKTGLARFFGGLGPAQKTAAAPEVDSTERDLRLKAFKRDFEKLEKLNPAFAKEMRDASALKDV